MSFSDLTMFIGSAGVGVSDASPIGHRVISYRPSAELLLDLNPFAERVKFARGGGEAMSVAIRIGRAASGKTKVLFSNLS